MTTQPIEKYHLSKLTEVFQELLKIKSSVDPEGIIAVAIFHRIEEGLAEMHKTISPSLIRLKSIETELIRLKHYLEEFDQYSRLSKRFFKETNQKFDANVLQSSYPFLAAKNIARQLFEDFMEGRYFTIGLKKSIDQLKHFMRLFWKQNSLPEAKIPIDKFEIFEQVYQKENEGDFDLNAYLSEYIDTTPNKISATRIKQIKGGYYHLYRKALVHLIEKKEDVKGKQKEEDYKLAKRLALLETGLRKQNEQVIYKALRLIQQLVQPVAILTPTNYTNTQQKLIKLTGISEPKSTMVLLINNQPPLKVVVGDDQKFVFDDIELQFGDNTLICYSQDFLFLDNHKYHLHIHLERHYPFIGMYDPLTQKAFQENEAQIIVRCTTCRNYEYDFSVEENNNRCVFPKCEGQTFWNWEDREYWMD